MADPLRVGKSRNHRERKNGASREAWAKRKAEANAARGRQIFISGTAFAGWSRVLSIETTNHLTGEVS